MKKFIKITNDPDFNHGVVSYIHFVNLNSGAWSCHRDKEVAQDFEGKDSEYINETLSFLKTKFKKGTNIEIEEESDDDYYSFPITLTQSRYWWQSKNIDWFIENAEFAFRKSNPIAYKERRLWIKTKVRYNHNEEADYEPKLNFNCFEFDTDRYGIIIKCETFLFNEHLPNEIIDKNFNVKQAFVKYLHKEEDEYGGGELKFLNPNLLRRLLSFRKSKHIKIK